MPDSSYYVIGANILDNLTTGMYADSRVIYREYIQNACDSIDTAERTGKLDTGQGVVEIYTDNSSRTITIRDNGTGISARDFKKKLGNIANSDKTLGESKGFRGIGRLCGLAYCETLVFSSKAKGEKIVSSMICDAKKMRDLINQNQSHHESKLSAAEVLDRIISYDQQEDKDIAGHWFEVKLIKVNAENHDLLARESVIDYLSFVAPVPFNKNFSFRSRIYEYQKKHDFPLNEYVVKVNGEQIFKDYRTHVKTSKGEDSIFDIQFHEFYDERNNVIAWMWYGLRHFQFEIDKGSLQRGLRLRKENIQLGTEDALKDLFKEPRGTHYFIGEVHAISRDLIPNSQRYYFNENPMRNTFESELKTYFADILDRLYHEGNKVSSAVDKIESYEKQKNEFERKKKNDGHINGLQQDKEKATVETAKKKAEDARKTISKELDRYKDNQETPIHKVVTRIIKERKAEEYISKYGQIPIDLSPTAEEESLPKSRDGGFQQEESPRKKTKWWTDRLTSVPKAERKLIARVIGVVCKCVDESTMNKILTEIEKEFK